MADNISNDYLNTRAAREQPERDAAVARLQAAIDRQNAPKSAAPAPVATAVPEASPGVIKETGKAVAGGLRDATQNAFNLIDDAGTWLNNNLIDLRVNSGHFGEAGKLFGGKQPNLSSLVTGQQENLAKTGEFINLPKVAENETTIGKLGRSVTQFLVPFMGTLKAVNYAAPVIKAGVKLTPGVAGAVAGAATDFTVFGPHDKRLSNMVLDLTDNNPVVGKPILQYLAADPNDSSAEGRFKNTLEGLGIGAAMEGLFLGIRALRAKWTAGGKKPIDVLEEARKPATPEQAAAVDAMHAPETTSLRDQIDVLTGANQRAPRDVYQARLDAIAAFKHQNELTATAKYDRVTPAPAVTADATQTAESILQRPGATEMRLADHPTEGIPFERPITPQQAAETMKLVEEQVAKNPDKIHHAFIEPTEGGIVFSKKAPSPTALPLEQTVQTALEKNPLERTAEDLIALRAYRQLQEAAFPGLIHPGAVTPHEIHPVEVIRSRARSAAKSMHNRNTPTSDIPAISVSQKGSSRTYGVKTPGGKTGGLEVTISDGAYRVNNSELPAVLRGKGVGTALYRHAVDEALSNGKAFHSDSSVSESAMNVYRRLEKEGYEVKFNPIDEKKTWGGEGGKDKHFTSPDGASPLVEVTGKQAANDSLDFTHSAQGGFISPTVLAHMAGASVGGVAGFNSAESDASFADKLTLAGLGAVAGAVGARVGLHKVLTGAERAIARNADPIVRSLATKEAAVIAPQVAPAAAKKMPVIHKAQVEALVTAAKAGGYHDLAAAVKASDFNFDHINTSADVKDMVDSFSNVFEKEVDVARHGEVQTHAQLAELADELGAGTASLKALYQGTDNLGARILAHRALLTASAEKVTNLAKMVSGDLPMSTGLLQDTAILALRKHVALHASIQAQMKGIQTEVGRALGQFRIASSSVDLAKNEVSSLLDALGGREANLQFAEELSRVTNPAKLNQALRLGAMARTKGALVEATVMGKLWSPATHVANTVGNLITVVGSVAERSAAHLIGKYIRRAPDAVPGGELKAQLFGLIGGMQDALHITSEGLAAVRQAAGSAAVGDFRGAATALRDNANEFGTSWQSLATGAPSGNRMLGTVDADLMKPAISADAAGWDPQKLPGILADALGTLIRIPGRPLAMADQLFFTMHYRGELRAQAYRAARQQGLEGDALINETARMMNDPSPTIRSQAVRAGQDGTFQTPLTGSQAGIARLINSVPGPIPALRLVIPFIRTPMNIMNYVGKRNPLTGFMAESYKADIAAGGATADLARARIAVGSSLMMLGAVAASEMDIGGAKVQLHGGGDFKKTSEKLGGALPYSLQIGDKYYTYNRLDPFGMFLGLSADFRDILGQSMNGGAEMSDLVSASVLSLGRNLTSKSYLSGLVDGIKALGEAARGNTKQLSQYVDRTAAGALPFSSAFNTARKVDDPMQREVWSMMDAFKNIIPGYSRDLPPSRNLFGEPVMFKAGLGPDIASPIQTSEATTDKAASEIARLNVDLQVPPRAIAGKLGSKAIDLSPEQYDTYTRVAGEQFKQMMTQAVNAPGWKDLPEDPGNSRYQDAKELQIKTLHNSAKAVAFAHLYTNDAKFRAAYEMNTENAAKVITGSGKPMAFPPK